MLLYLKAAAANWNFSKSTRLIRNKKDDKNNNLTMSAAKKEHSKLKRDTFLQNSFVCFWRNLTEIIFQEFSNADELVIEKILYFQGWLYFIFLLIKLVFNCWKYIQYVGYAFVLHSFFYIFLLIQCSTELGKCWLLGWPQKNVWYS